MVTVHSLAYWILDEFQQENFNCIINLYELETQPLWLPRAMLCAESREESSYQ